MGRVVVGSGKIDGSLFRYFKQQRSNNERIEILAFAGASNLLETNCNGSIWFAIFLLLCLSPEWVLHKISGENAIRTNTTESL